MTLTNPLVTLAIGIGIGWAVRCAQTWVRFGWDSAWLDKQSLDAKRFAADYERTNALLEAADADTNLELLACLDNGQVPEVKKVLIHKLGDFYQRWTTKPPSEAMPESIQKSLTAIRLAAKECKSVQSALTSCPSDDVERGARE